MIRSPLLPVVASSLAVVLAGCGGGTRKVSTPVQVAPAPARRKPPKPKPKPKPVCVAQSEQSVIGMSWSDGDLVQYCVADGSSDARCYAVDLVQKKWEKLDSPPIPQTPSMTPAVARLQSTPAEVKVCTIADDTCKSLKPRIRAGDNPLEAAVNAQGTVAAILIGDAEAGKGQIQVWNVAKRRKTAAIKYAKGAFRCGTAHVLDDVVFVSAGMCDAPQARGALYSTKGKRLANVGGPAFGTYGSVPVQIGDKRWAFLSENASVIAIHESSGGKLEKTIDLLALWEGGSGGPGMEVAGPGGNPGESALLRGPEGKLLVITGSPRAGAVGVVDVEAGTVEAILPVLCTADDTGDAPAPDADADTDADTDADRGGATDSEPVDELD